MQTTDLCDTVTVRPTPDGAIRLSCSDPGVPCGAKNTAYLAASYFTTYTHCGFGADITIDKRIPHGAGLGGGSADAAAVLRAMNRISPVKEEELLELALRVGADVPYCVRGGTALCQNIGEVISPLPPLPDCRAVIVMPDCEISTADAYRQIDESPAIRHPDGRLFLYHARRRDLAAMCRTSANVFEQVVEVPGRADIKAVMRAHGAVLAMMSGSGAAVYGLFTDGKSAGSCARELGKAYERVFTAGMTGHIDDL